MIVIETTDVDQTKTQTMSLSNLSDIHIYLYIICIYLYKHIYMFIYMCGPCPKGDNQFSDFSGFYFSSYREKVNPKLG